MNFKRVAVATTVLLLAPGIAAADGVIGTAEGELPFEGLYVKDVAALNVIAFRAAMTVDFRKVERIEFVEIDTDSQMATVRITFLDSYAMPATFSLADNAPWVAIGPYGRANYSAESLLGGDIQYVQFIHEPGEDGATDGDEPATDSGN